MKPSAISHRLAAVSYQLSAAWTAVLALVLCAALPLRLSAQAHKVVLVSLDGFRADYLERPGAVHLRQLATEGVRAAWMQPSFPSITFPNHYTIVTGLYPEHHGIVGNSMRDPALGRFSLSDSAANADPRWWGGEPIWATAEKQGKHAAVFFWPGSEAGQGGARPEFWRHYDGRVSFDARVAQVLQWLAMKNDSAPQFIAVYFSEPDHQGHMRGPDSPQVDTAIAEVDAEVGKLLAGIDSLGMKDQVDVVVVSDHGMAAISPDRVVYLDDYVPDGWYTLIEAGPGARIAPKAGYVDSVYRRLKGANPHLAVYLKSEVPARFHYDANPRIPAIVAIADDGWYVTTHAWAARHPVVNGGEHGYDNALPAMRALFVAEGPDFKRGARVGAFQNIHVYDLLARLLHLTPAPNDGSPDSTAAMLR
ncbi:MAG TPA: nucleotide pyrophosphatase/phosphodiesterase family protein [Gemmatimonadales bacterium]|nr:nucleotide pyrophosphatase/phosphodiesterase family protein [Gemmatimonadales bacterium]